MSDIDKITTLQLVKRLKDLKARSGDGFNPPAWMLDENRYGEGDLTPKEQQEWAETVCQSMRSVVALQYLIESEKRWGLRDGSYQFKSGVYVFQLTRELLENLLIKHIDETLIEHRPEERYLAVFQFYYANDRRLESDSYSWFSDFLDDIFIGLVDQMRSDEATQPQPIVH